MSLLTSIVGYYKFDENSGTSVGDATGVGNSGTFSGTTPYYKTGKINAGGNFNGSDTNVTFTSVSSQNSLSQLTVSVWVNIAGNGLNGLGRIIQKLNASNGYFQINMESSTTTIVFSASWATTVGIWRYTAPSQNVWHHIAVTYDGSSVNNVPTFYIDNASQSLASSQTPAGSRTTDDTNMYIGNRGDTTRTFNGTIDEIGLWSRLLSSSEISQLYNGGNGLQYPFGVNVPVANFASGSAPQPSSSAAIIN